MTRTHFITLALVGSVALGFAAWQLPTGDTSQATSAAILSSTPDTALDTAEFKAALNEGRTLIDVRTASEYATGHLSGARLIDFRSTTFSTDIAVLPTDGSYALYCRSGNRSEQALVLMQELGFTDVVHLEGGITAWSDAGNEVCINC